MAQDAQADLDKALPAFESAVKSLKSLSKSDLVEVKGYAWHLMASDGVGWRLIASDCLPRQVREGV